MLRYLAATLLAGVLLVAGIKVFAPQDSLVYRKTSGIVNPAFSAMLSLRASMYERQTQRLVIESVRPNLDPLIVAHGTSIQFGPRNSLPAIESAIKQGVDYVEIDVRYTRDRVAVLLHNADLDRGTTGTGLLADQYFSQLADIRLTLDKTYWGEGGESTDVGIPTLESALQTMRDRVCVVWDPKETPDAATVKLFRDFGFAHGCLLIMGGQDPANDTQLMIRLFWPDAPILVGLPEPGQATDLVQRYPHMAAFSSMRGMSHETVDAAHSVGMPIYTWLDGEVFDGPRGYARTVAAGYDIVMLDRYDEFMAFIEKAKSQSGAADGDR